MLRHTRTFAILTTLGAVVLTGCSSTDEPTQADSNVSDTSGGKDSGSGSKSDPNCLPVSMKMLRAIASGGDNAKLKPIAGAAYRSDDFEKVYMIAMRFNGLGSTEEGVWASNSLKPGGGLIMSVDGMAEEFTQWPNGTADSPMSIADHGAHEALDCLPDS